MPDFPNLFLLKGPSGPVGNFSLIDSAEKAVFASGDTSWYLDDSGAPQTWPLSQDHFAEVVSKLKLGDHRQNDTTREARR